ncbi:TetR/AcrR family transcriptional regulator [Cobetia marina]|jgi:AcrR family transcriptional regulator|uniref:TetR-like C-terminal domain-containing protein n=2 Tax=Gammaproteobacteria TaxID=1236 RepID=A0ABU9GKE4_COBMA|nr:MULTISPECIES: TetR-like C-terminal domain-containing protein [Cobetia]AOM00198.1 TetR family transcriptional regulator [Cobetia marina]MDA5565406.1 TetR-like C-terminal domain-containing protein [Cobetia sp. MMG027]MDH2292938.1 TetR-like C-terminal domain-containing protein [Cobetia sp. 10Alg 146]MDH2375446.1 TetR-like C-terminal domain-containing protein [Cobetia sp. 3AK]MDI6005226.1 TetR-like C-terminal domain-containing protein [Cobetia pacifica]
MARPRQHAPEALHARVMETCDEWLKQQPVHALSLRNLAREVGCAPSTLLKLYGSFGNLLQHVNLTTLDRLRDAIAGQETPSPSQRLKALARAYWGFAQRDPYRWQLLFDFPLAQEGELDQRQNAMIEGLFERVELALVEYAPKVESVEAKRMARTLWGSVHGLVQLGMNERLGLWQGQPLEVTELLDQLLDTMLAGLKVRSEAAGSGDATEAGR